METARRWLQNSVIECIMQSGNLIGSILIAFRSNGIVDRAEVGCQLPVCHTAALKTMRAISQPISKGSSGLLFVGDC